MLVLSRITNEQIVIGEGDSAIVVTIVRIHKGTVRVGIEAPKNVPVHRREFYDAIHRAIAEGRPLRPIEDRLDAEENQNKDADATKADAKERQEP